MPVPGGEHVALGVEDAAKRLVDREIGRDGRQQFAERSKLSVVERRPDVAAAKHGSSAAEPRPAAFEPIRLIGQI
jgi:hypothetical protein